MGQYFKFYNLTKDEWSDIPLPFNFGLPWAKSLERDCYSERDLQMIFLYVITHNGWSKEDHVSAFGDYDDEISCPDLEGCELPEAWKPK